jgi:hypothetical protein
MRIISTLFIAIALSVGSWFSGSNSFAHPQNPIVVQTRPLIYHTREDGIRERVPITLTEWDAIQKDPDLVLDLFKAAKITCPEERTRVDACTWVCGNGTKVITCSRSIQKALTQVWDKNDITHPQ